MAPAPYSVGAGTPVSGRAGLSRGPFPARSIGPERFRGPVAPSAEAGRFGTGRPRSPARDQRVRAVMALRHGRWQRRRVGGSPDFRSIIGLYSPSGGQRPCAEPSSPKTAYGAPCGTTVTGRSSTRNAGPMPAGSPRAGRRWPPPRCARRRGRAWSPCVPMSGSATAGRSTSPPIPAAGGPDRETPPPRLVPASPRHRPGPVRALPAGAQAARVLCHEHASRPGGHGDTRNRQPSERSRTAKTEETGVERQGGGQRCCELGKGYPTRAKPDSRGIRHEVDERPVWQRELGTNRKREANQ